LAGGVTLTVPFLVAVRPFGPVALFE